MAAEKNITAALEQLDDQNDPGISAALSGNLADTPRTKEALRRVGVMMSELKIKSFQDFYIPTDNVEKQRLRYNHYESRRQEKLSLVLKERAKVFVELTKKQTDNQTNVKSYQNLNMLEQLLDAEAGRLESELKQQLRYHTVVEAENKEQLEREQKVRVRQRKRDDRVLMKHEEIAAKSRHKAVASKAKMDHSKKIVQKCKDEHEAKTANFLSQVLETEVRIREFRKGQEGRSFEKSQQWQVKCASIQQNFQNIQVG